MMVTVPLEDFDQSKLEQYLRKTPIAWVREEDKGTFVRRHYLFPPEGGAPFRLRCHGDHYFGSNFPSEKKCSLTTSATARGDEVRIEMENQGLPLGKFASTERVYGRAFDGRSRQLFRYLFDCNEHQCRISFALKEPTP